MSPAVRLVPARHVLRQPPHLAVQTRPLGVHGRDLGLKSVALTQQSGENKLLGLEAQPFMTKNLDKLAILHQRFRPAVHRIAAAYNQKILYMVPWPRKYVYTKVPAKTVADLRVIKVRTYNASTTEIFNRIGMTAVQLPWGEVVPSLAAGTIDAVTTSRVPASTANSGNC